MPISYTIDVERAEVSTMASGVLTGAELREFRKALLEDPRFRPGMRELSDIRRITHLEVTSGDVGTLVAIEENYTERIRSHEVAILVGSEVSFGMARMYQMRSNREGRVAVFRDEKAARAWVDRPRDPEPEGRPGSAPGSTQPPPAASATRPVWKRALNRTRKVPNG